MPSDSASRWVNSLLRLQTPRWGGGGVAGAGPGSFLWTVRAGDQGGSPCQDRGSGPGRSCQHSGEVTRRRREPLSPRMRGRGAQVGALRPAAGLGCSGHRRPGPPALPPPRPRAVRELAQGLTAQGGCVHPPCARGVQFPAREWDFHFARVSMQSLDALDTEACAERRRA